MAKRSLKATPVGIAKAKQAFQRTGWTQEYLAGEVGLETRQSIWKFFSGRPVERHIFIDICFRLDLDWEEIAEPPQVDPLSVHLADVAKRPKEKGTVDQWAQQAKANLSHRLTLQCDALHSPLPLSVPLTVSQIYTEVKFTNDLSHQCWHDKDELEELFWQDATSSDFSIVQPQWLSSQSLVTETPRLVVIGNMGAGKTTVLKQLALQCNQGKLQPQCVPLFVSLKTLIKNDNTIVNLKTYVTDQLSQGGLSLVQAEAVLAAGRVLLLLDGLDELQPNQEITKDIQSLCQQFPNIPVVISHRPIGVGVQFPGFHYVEIIDFDDHQIHEFSQKWFTNRGATNGQYQRFIEYLDDPKYLALKQLARCPLMLTMLCIVFQKKNKFLVGDSRLYRTVSELFVNRWNHIKGLDSSLVVSEIDIPSVLGWLANQMLESDQVFIEHQQLLGSITEYLTKEARLSLSPLSKQRISEDILETILQQTCTLTKRSQDIYAFTHLILQQYLAAQYLALKVKHHKHQIEIKVLAEKFKSPLWIEAGLLLGYMLPQGYRLIDKICHNLNQMVKQDQTLDRLASCLDTRMENIVADGSSQPAKTLHQALFHNQSLDFLISLRTGDSSKQHHEATSDATLYQLLAIIDQLANTPTLENCQRLTSILDSESDVMLAAPFHQVIQTLKSSLKPVFQSTISAQTWWLNTGQSWAQNFVTIMVEHRDIGHAWLLTLEQKAYLQEYFRINYVLNNLSNTTSFCSSPSAYPLLQTA